MRLFRHFLHLAWSDSSWVGLVLSWSSVKPFVFLFVFRSCISVPCWFAFSSFVGPFIFLQLSADVAFTSWVIFLLATRFLKSIKLCPYLSFKHVKRSIMQWTWNGISSRFHYLIFVAWRCFGTGSSASFFFFLVCISGMIHPRSLLFRAFCYSKLRAISFVLVCYLYLVYFFRKECFNVFLIWLLTFFLLCRFSIDFFFS